MNIMNEENNQNYSGMNFDPETGERINRAPSGSYGYTPAWSPEGSADPQPKKKKGGWARVLALVLCCILIGGCAGVGGAMFMLKRTGDKAVTQEETVSVPEVLPEPAAAPAPQESVPDETSVSINTGRRESSVISTNEVDTGKLMTASEVYAVNVASTVGITAGITTNYWGYSSTASGMFIKDYESIVVSDGLYNVCSAMRA